MKKIIIITGIALFASCGSEKQEAGQPDEIRAEIENLKKQRAGIDEKIVQLETQLSSIDTAAVSAGNARLVEVTTLEPKTFEHFIDLQGRIATEDIYYVTPRGMGGQVKMINVKQGDRVRKGQLLMRLDDALVRQQAATLNTQLNYAKDLYGRQQNLWKEGIGTEVQVLNARNAVDNLEKQLGVLNEQLAMTEVHAQVNGVVETVNIRVGEVFTGNPMAGITIVNPDNLKAVVDVPENYISRVSKGVPAVVELPDQGLTYKTTISLVSQLIGQTTRSFTAEAKLPSGARLKPNQVAVVRILDHASVNAIVVPLATLQSDEKGKFVYVMKEKNGAMTAAKRQVTIGELYDEVVEVKAGLNKGDRLITQGFQGLYDGQVITLK